jgi:hypothetical protein
MRMPRSKSKGASDKKKEFSTMKWKGRNKFSLEMRK